MPTKKQAQPKAKRQPKDTGSINKFYDDIKTAFDYYNAEFWGGELPPVFLSVRAKANSAGYFSPNRLHKPEEENKGKAKKVKSEQESVHEIAFNPSTFNRPITFILSTLVHEMVHLWQEEHGTKKSKNGYHNKEWAGEMERIGLIPSSTGEPGGAKTGQHMGDYIEAGGWFDRVTRDLVSKHDFNLFYEYPHSKKKAPNSKVKFTCPKCGSNAWGKPDLEIDCRPCGFAMDSEE